MKQRTEFSFTNKYKFLFYKTPAYRKLAFGSPKMYETLVHQTLKELVKFILEKYIGKEP